MKKVSGLVMFTLFFSSLAGVGLTAGFYCFIAVAHLLSRLLWGTPA
ncbi:MULTISPECIES: sodium:solute symporter [Symbiopectobacterium]|nr:MULTISPECIES: sodium:solute symporter [Symbiopectobacterium]MBG6246998.1 sodium:solute symporter [Candidatus Symbiopectobacterium sp. PLON1]MBT9429069.1 sodium:solute symporter [Candidatus Symbiopectobacterium endolongispinus]